MVKKWLLKLILIQFSVAKIILLCGKQCLIALSSYRSLKLIVTRRGRSKKEEVITGHEKATLICVQCILEENMGGSICLHMCWRRWERSAWRKINNMNLQAWFTVGYCLIGKSSHIREGIGG